MDTQRKIQDKNDFKKMIKTYLKQGRNKLLNEFTGTREAMGRIATEKIKILSKLWMWALTRRKGSICGIDCVRHVSILLLWLQHRKN